MEMDDLVLVSVDDHVVEPPDLFEGHLPDRYMDLAPKFITRDDGTPGERRSPRRLGPSRVREGGQQTRIRSSDLTATAGGGPA